MDESERKAREQLAALYRVIARLKMSDLIDTHISVRIPGTEDLFLINQYGVLFEEMTPESLVKIDPAGQAVDPAHGGSVNAAGFTIHSACHMARADVSCVIHTHTADGIGVACQQEGLLPISQHALRFYGQLSYHDYEGVALDLGERERLVKDLGSNNAMILRNHGLLALGRTIAEAFTNIYYLERACQIQVRAQAGGTRLNAVPEDVRIRTNQQFNTPGALEYCEKVWTAAQRMVSGSNALT